MFHRKSALSMTLSLFLTLSAAAQTQTPVTGQTPQSQSLQEELRQMRQLMDQMRRLIERQEALIKRLEEEKLEAEKKEAAAKSSPTKNETASATNKESTPAAADKSKDNGQTNGGAGASDQSQTSASSKDKEKDKDKDKGPTLTADDRDTLDFWRDTTVNVTVDGYYGYNFNRPLGGINLLRAYDVLSNNFSLNQAGVIFERPPKVEDRRRFGARLDLMFGQATETLQGSAVNELRPQVYRHVWQAYGTYVAPLGKGLTVDFGKFASAFGYESNYTKDNFNYSRSFFFLFLPFYHFGFRTSYPFNEKFTASYWLVNGLNQSEDFNGWKSQAVLLTFKPTSRITAQANYYSGREQRVRTSILNPTFPVLPTQPGLSPVEIRPAPNGRLHILDGYATFNITDRLTFAFEGDYVISRTFNNFPPSRVTGGVAYARYQFSPGFAMASRFEYLSDRLSDFSESLFSGFDQALKEVTLTAEYKFGDGFLLRGEYRRDWSNIPFFLTDIPGVFKKEQNTATLGLVWWFGRKKGVW